jgi:DNA/RNA-binding domain of Phe-tRNA-synthetase-like protein
MWDAMNIDGEVRERFPDLNVLTVPIRNITVKKESQKLEAFKREFISKIRSQYNLETLKDVPELRLYRDFFWKIGIDPTKTRPASEALIRRVIQGKPLPKINTLVDSYNLASMESRVPLAAFDEDMISSELILRFAAKDEEFTGIGMKTPVLLEGNELVIQSGSELIALYPHRDADRSKITLSTGTVLLVVCGVPGISGETLDHARAIAEEYIIRFCGEDTT